MRCWVEIKWKTLLRYMPSVVRLMNGWYNFHFHSQDDLNKMKTLSWIKGRGFFELHSWYIRFNPLKEMPKNKLIWVELPSLSIELWTQQVFIDIGNAIGKFLYVETQCLGGRDKITALILIKKEFMGGLPDYIELLFEGTHLVQRLDFLGVPFRCLIFQHTRHLMAQCPRQMGRIHMAHRWIIHWTKDKASRWDTNFVVGQDATGYVDSTHHCSCTPPLFMPFPSFELNPNKCDYSSPIMVPSSPQTSNGSVSPVANDTSFSPS